MDMVPWENIRQVIGRPASTPLFVLLVGLPGSGKSYWRERNCSGFAVISSDDELERIAAARGETYEQIFKDEIGNASAAANRTFRRAIEHRHNIMWDQTNLAIKKRKKVLSQVPADYFKAALYFEVPDDVRAKRVASRKGKAIDQSVLDAMQASYVRPTIGEGFDLVLGV